MWLFWNAIRPVVAHDDTTNAISMVDATLKCLQLEEKKTFEIWFWVSNTRECGNIFRVLFSRINVHIYLTAMIRMNAPTMKNWVSSAKYQLQSMHWKWIIRINIQLIKTIKMDGSHIIFGGIFWIKNMNKTNENVSVTSSIYHLFNWKQSVYVKNVTPPIVWAIFMIRRWRFKNGIVMEIFHNNFDQTQYEHIRCS